MIDTRVEPWMTDAACAGHDPELWHPIQPDARRSRQARAAIRICRRCPVQDECLRWAYRHGDREAILGGMTPRQRAHHSGRPAPAPRPPGPQLAEQQQAIVRMREAGVTLAAIGRMHGVSSRQVQRRVLEIDKTLAEVAT